MSVKQVTLAGTSGSVSIEVAEGSTVRKVLIEAAEALGLELAPESIDRLSPVVDSKPARLTDVVPETASRVSAGPRVQNG